MRRNTAVQLAKALASELDHSVQFHLSDEINTFPLESFHSFANSKPCLGAFKVEKAGSEKLWLSVIDWRDDGNYYFVIYPENNNLAPIAELHDQRAGTDTVDLVWTYSPRERDGRNEERKEAFLHAVGRPDYVVSLPSALVALEDFLEDVFSLASHRVAADELTNVASEPGTFPEGRRIERLHQSRERDSRAVRQAKAAHAQRNGGALPCEVCDFAFSTRYGELGSSYIEAHHTRPLSDLEGGELRDTTVNDFALVCANCHRMLHRRRPWATVEQLRRLMESET